ncbi:MAG TPA: hypothetical protein VNY75_01815 [Rhizomicrobium sp.]|nr:hypothetical protein [Rhizomicrobium sp.]
MMRGIPATHGLKRGLFLAFALTAGLGLAACSDIDSLFGGDSGDMTASDAPTAGDTGAPPTAAAPVAMAASSGGAPVATITPVTIDAGPDTGTAVNKTIQSLRAQVAGLQQKLAANSARLGDLRNQGAGAAGSYQQAKAHITTRLQVGTTRGNPELVAEWNTAQGQLDALSANVNALSALGTDATNDSSTAHFALDQIGATFNVSGAVDEDHRQLQLLEDQTSQTIVMIDRLLKEVSDGIQRQTAYVATERANLSILAAAIKSGDFYGGGVVGSLGGGAQTASAGAPLVVVKFDHPDVDYQQILYAALSQALQNRPGANFQVVAVSPTRGSAASVQIAQSTARRHAQDVMRSMTDMGVPATRLNVASTTDPAATTSEVRVFVR